MKRFERSNGLDTALYKNYLYFFFFTHVLCLFPSLPYSLLQNGDVAANIGAYLLQVRSLVVENLSDVRQSVDLDSSRPD